MTIFYDISYSNRTHEIPYNQIALSDDQLDKLFYSDKTSLLDTSNIIDLLSYSLSDDLYSAYKKFQIQSLEQLEFLSDYIFQYLNLLYIHPLINDDPERIVYLDSLSTAFISLLQISVDKTLPKLQYGINRVVISKLITFTTTSISDNICNDIMMNVLNDTDTTQIICSDKYTYMADYESIKNWVTPYQCYNIKCEDSNIELVKQNLIKIGNFTNDQLNEIYSRNNLGKYISTAISDIKSTYECSKCDDEELGRIQWLSGNITLNPPEGLVKTNTIAEWDSSIFPIPYELKYSIISSGCKIKDCNDLNMSPLLSLLNSINSCSPINNIQSYGNKLNLQKLHSMYIHGVYKSDLQYNMKVHNPRTYFNAINSFVQSTMFIQYNQTSLNEINTLYTDPLKFLNGNASEDKLYLELLNYGSFYENFKPNVTMTTGISLDKLFDDYTVKTGFAGNEKNVRIFTKLNGMKYLNKKSNVYSPISKDYTLKNTLLSQSEYGSVGISDIRISDGFQYPSGGDSIKYYDRLSSSVLDFRYYGQGKFGNKLCDKYVLKLDKIQYVDEKFNKPYVITKYGFFNDIPEGYSGSVNITNLMEDSDGFNFVCMDQYSGMVIQANVSLVVSYILIEIFIYFYIWFNKV